MALGRLTGDGSDGGASRERRWRALALLSVVQFMIVLDTAIVSVALPSIQTELGFSQGNLQWILSAYVIALGGFVLLGGRAADLLGRRRMLMVGLAVFGLASLLAGLAWNDVALVGARGLQGLGAALISPAALSLLTASFREGADRNVALGVWGAVGGLGGAAGVSLGGVMTATVGWEWAFFLNLPVVAVTVALVPVVLDESRSGRARGFDLRGALLVSAGLSSTVLAISRAGATGWRSVETLCAGAAAFALLIGFVAAERRAVDPLVSLDVLRVRAVRAANLTGLLLSASVGPMFLMLTLYMQQVLGFTPLQAGLAYLTIAGTTILWSTVASRLVSRVGARPVLVTGLGLLALGLAWFAQMPVDGSYRHDLLPGFLLVAVGMPFSFVSVNVAGLSGVPARDAGFGSGLLGTSQQIGAALGIAVLSSLAVARAAGGPVAPASAASTSIDGLHVAFQAAALIALTGALLALLLLRSQPVRVVAAPGRDDEGLLAAPA